jgi:ring-1,2-phenylacetyl-CoA epoxidase subunit PaaE
MPVIDFHSLLVEDVTRDAEESVRLRLTLPPPLIQVFSFVPGQHITVRVRVGERTLRRNYSLVSPPGCGHLEIAVRTQRDGRVSGFLSTQIKPGMTLEVFPPSGRFRLPPLESGPAHVLALAAGSGVTPVFAIVRDHLEHAPDAHCTVIVANQTLARAMLREDWLGLKDRYLARLALYFVMSREPQHIEWLNGRLDREWLTKVSGRLFDAPSLAAALLCGPAGFITDLSEGLQALGVPAERIHFERFTIERSSQVAAASIRDAVLDDESRPQTEVTVVMDGRRRSFMMPRDGTSVLQAAEKAGFALPYSCRDGICSTCRVKVLDGEVTLGQQYALEAWELKAGFTLACQAQPRSERLILSYDER